MSTHRVTITLAHKPHNPSDAELLRLHTKWVCTAEICAKHGDDMGEFDADCTVFEIENELTERGLPFSARTIA